MEFDQIDRLLVFFANQLDSFDLGFAFGAGLHSSFLYLVYGATGITAALALVSLGTSTVGRSVGSKLDPADVARSIVMATILLAPQSYDVSNRDDSRAYDEFTKHWNVDLVKDSGADADGTIKHVPPEHNKVYVSAAALLFHRVAMLLNKLIVSAADEFLENEGVASSDTGGTNLWVYRVLNRSYSDDAKKGPAFMRSWTAYRDYCTRVAATSEIGSPQVWRKFGLLGGLFFEGEAGYFNSHEIGTGADVEAAKEILKETNIEPLLLQNYPAGFQIHSASHWITVFVGKDGSIDRGFWRKRNSSTDGHLAPRLSYGAFLATADPNETINIGTGTITAGELAQRSYFPKTCYDLYDVNARAAAEIRAGAETSSHTLEKKVGWGTPEIQRINSATISSLVQRTYSEASGSDRGVVLGLFNDMGAGLFSWLEAAKLQTTIPILLGTLMFAYALAVAIYPFVIAFSVLPGRGSLALMYFKIVAVIFITTVLMFLIIRLMSSIMVGLMVTFVNSVATDANAAVKLANFALAGQVALFAGIAASPFIAWSLVFNDPTPLQRSARVPDGGTMLKTTAGAAGTAMFVAGAAGKVGKLAAGASKVTQPNTTTINMINIVTTEDK